MKKVELRSAEYIWVPKCVNTIIKNTPRAELRTICKDFEQAKDLIFLMASQFMRSYSMAIKKEEDICIHLNAEVLRKSVSFNYLPILKFLKDNNVIKYSNSYKPGVYSKSFWLTDYALSKGIREVKINNKIVLKNLKKYKEYVIVKAEANTIASHLLEVYSSVTLPNSQDLLKKGKAMVKVKTKNKKGKYYKMRGKKSKSETFQNKSCRFIEDDIDLFKQLTSNGVKAPTVGNSRSGGRIVCAFALVPTWIRNCIKIDSEETVEVDYSCLHPNIANKLYGLDKVAITHEIVAESLEKSKNEIKKEHLSLFNSEYKVYKNLDVAEYYKSFHKELYENVLKIKDFDIKNGTENTVTYAIFSEEVKLMTRVFEKFSEQGIKALYIYDAVRVKKSDSKLVSEIMNETAEELQIQSSAVIA